MHGLIGRMLGLSLALVAYGPSAASDDVTAFSAACLDSRDLYEVAGFENENLQHLCDCLARDFADNLEADQIDYLRRDLLGQSRPEESDPALSAYGGEAMRACLALEGLIQGQDVEPEQ